MFNPNSRFHFVSSLRYLLCCAWESADVLHLISLSVSPSPLSCLLISILICCGFDSELQSAHIREFPFSFYSLNFHYFFIIYWSLCYVPIMCIILIKCNYCRYKRLWMELPLRGDLTFTLLEYSSDVSQDLICTRSGFGGAAASASEVSAVTVTASGTAIDECKCKQTNKQTHHGAYWNKTIFSRIVIISSHFIHFMAFFEMKIINYTYFVMCLMSDEDFNDFHVPFGGLTGPRLEMCDWSVL